MTRWMIAMIVVALDFFQSEDLQSPDQRPGGSRRRVNKSPVPSIAQANFRRDRASTLGRSLFYETAGAQQESCQIDRRSRKALRTLREMQSFSA